MQCRATSSGPGVRFVSVRDHVDAWTASGQLLRNILASFAEYEREVISERIRAGIARARSTGKHWGGRKVGVRPKLTRQTLRSIGTLLKSGTPKAQIARQLHIDRSTVYGAADDATFLNGIKAQFGL